MSLYTKTKSGEFIPIEINSIMNKDFNNKLVIVKVGSDMMPATLEDLEETERSFARATVLDEVDNVSVILTPYQIEIDLLEPEEIEDKHICIQIISGEDISALDEQTKLIYKRLRKRYSNTTILPVPLRLKEYKEVKNIIKRCKLRKSRRGRVRG